MEERDENKISKFSSGLNIIMRLDILWKNCQEFKRHGKYLKWNDELDTVWLELARDLSPKKYYDLNEEGTVLKKEDFLKDEEGKKVFDKDSYEKKVKTRGYESQFLEFDKKINLLLPFIDNPIGFKKIEKEDLIKRDKQYKILMEKQIFLARLENELDKGTTYEEEDDDF